MKESYMALKVVECPMVRGDIRTLAACRKCKFHDRVRMVRPPGTLKTPERPEGLPASYQVLCKLPTGIMVKEFPVEPSVADELKEAAEQTEKDITHTDTGE